MFRLSLRRRSRPADPDQILTRTWYVPRRQIDPRSCRRHSGVPALPPGFVPKTRPHLAVRKDARAPESDEILARAALIRAIVQWGSA